MMNNQQLTDRLEALEKRLEPLLQEYEQHKAQEPKQEKPKEGE